MFSSEQAEFAKTISEIINCNPFLPRRIELERKALGKRFVEKNANWNLHASEHQETENLTLMQKIAEDIISDCLSSDASFNETTRPLYLDLVRFVLFNGSRNVFQQTAELKGKGSATFFRKFRKAWFEYCPPQRFPDEVGVRSRCGLALRL